MTPDALLRLFYESFNQRRLTDTDTLFTEDVVFELLPSEPPLRGRNGFAEFVVRWSTAFPDAHMMPLHVEQRGETMCEVEMTVTGTHLGLFDLGAYRFKPSGVSVTLRLRQLFEFHEGRIAFTSLTFDLQNLVGQLATIDLRLVDTHLDGLNLLRVDLGRARDEPGRRVVADQMVVEVDALRNVLRPSYSRT
ncbi:MAG TPA: ester cyclase [Vicinamibacterales bacterium]|nr:ester cyclase [Vicinamibacterales bacterium]